MVVRSALQLGFSLSELARVLVTRDGGGAPCAEVRRLGQRRLQRLEGEIRRLLGVRKRLRGVLGEWDRRLECVRAGERAHLLEALVPVTDRAEA
jgi:DNA-binding transcriptional MerR regulator